MEDEGRAEERRGSGEEKRRGSEGQCALCHCFLHAEDHPSPLVSPHLFQYGNNKQHFTTLLSVLILNESLDVMEGWIKREPDDVSLR